MKQNSKKTNNLCVIDIGTNSTKCAIYNAMQENIIILPNKSACSKEFKDANLNTNNIDIKKTTQNISEYIAEAISAHRVLPRNVQIIATEGIRRAPQSQKQKLLKAISALTLKKWNKEIQVEVISPKKEAELAIHGILSNIKPKNKQVLIIESGGSSTEVSLINLENPQKVKILKTASIALGNANFDENTAKETIYAKIEELNLGRLGKIETIINADSAFHIIKRHHNTDLKDAQGKVINFQDFIKSLTNITRRKENLGYNRSFILKEILTNIDIDDFAPITASLSGLKEGLLIKTIKEQKSQPKNSNNKFQYFNKIKNFFANSRF